MVGKETGLVQFVGNKVHEFRARRANQRQQNEARQDALSQAAKDQAIDILTEMVTGQINMRQAEARFRSIENLPLQRMIEHYFNLYLEDFTQRGAFSSTVNMIAIRQLRNNSAEVAE